LYLETLESLPQPTFSALHEPFEFPHLLMPIDKADPSKVIGNGYTAQLVSHYESVRVLLSAY
jgi:hypothetical protein